MKAGGFDAVIGNPPYIRIQTMKEWAPAEVEFYKRKYVAASKGNYDIYVVFVERCLELLNASGSLGFILPHKFLNSQYGQPLRGLISRGRHLRHMVHFGDEQVFSNATTYTCLLFLSKSKNAKASLWRVSDLQDWRASERATKGTIANSSLTDSEWNLVTGKDASLFARLTSNFMTLGNVASIFVGLQTSADSIYIVEEISPEKRGMVGVRDRDGNKWMLEREMIKPFLSHVTMSPFVQPDAAHWLVFPYRIADDKATLISAAEMSRDFPNAWAYMMSYESELRNRDSGRADNEKWFGYVYRKNLTLFDTPKLIVQVISQNGRYAFDSKKLYFTGGGNGPYYGIRWAASDDSHSIHYLQALLNSRLLDFYLRKVSSPFRGGYWSYGKRFIEQLPIHRVDFKKKADVSRHNRVVELAERMLALQEQLPNAKTDQDKAVGERQIATAARQLNHMVYELYGLTDGEIALVEAAES